ncbi:MAG TPA: glycosyltransferase [Methylophilaceae bacterium]|nr:glycosyltransferase [Methylophilaceae bacterium]
MTDKLHILLPVHNRRAITESFVECLVAQTYKNYHLILVDDGSTDGTSAMVQAKIPNLTVIKGKGDWWWAGSLQQGLNWLKKSDLNDDALLLFINDDVSFQNDYLERGISLMANNAGVLMLSRFIADDGQISETGVCADLKTLTFNVAKSNQQINCLSTRGLFAYWKDIKLIGDFHPILLPHYLSDYEYTIRAHNKGFKCETSPDLLIKPNLETTGYHTISQGGIVQFLKHYFSKKSPGNPVYFTMFILLTGRSMSIIKNILNLWLHAIKLIVKTDHLAKK